MVMNCSDDEINTASTIDEKELNEVEDTVNARMPNSDPASTEKEVPNANKYGLTGKRQKLLNYAWESSINEPNGLYYFTSIYEAIKVVMHFNKHVKGATYEMLCVMVAKQMARRGEADVAKVFFDDDEIAEAERLQNIDKKNGLDERKDENTEKLVRFDTYYVLGGKKVAQGHSEAAKEATPDTTPAAASANTTVDTKQK
jgi:hypothetical protein